MTAITPDSPETGAAGDTAQAMRAIAAGLEAAGLTAHLHDTRGVLDITASLDRPGAKQIGVIVDDDGHVELGYWNPPGARPAQVTATISRALAAITAAQRA